MVRINSNDKESAVVFMPAGRRGRVPTGTFLLDAARQVGVEIESICGGRLTCGKCKVKVETGTFPKHELRSEEDHVSPPSEEEAELLARLGAEGYRLSCSTCVQGDVLVTVPEESQARKQIIRKSATERVIEIDPAVRQVYVEVSEARLEDQTGDWERLRAALAEQWELEGATPSTSKDAILSSPKDAILSSPKDAILSSPKDAILSSPKDAPSSWSRGLRIDYFALRDLQQRLREGEWTATVTLWQDQEVLDVRPGYQEGAYGLAVDVGSTTVAAYLCDLRTGQVLATEATMNPQVAYGEDLMSRVSYATMHADGLAKMRRAIVDSLNQLAGRAAAEAGIKISDIYEIVLVGNTVMHHILLGIDPVELGQAPFALATHDAIDVKARDLGLRLHPAANAHVLPVEAGHVGADNVGVLLAEAPHTQDEQMLIIDIGTNGEILLGNRERLFSASSPTGPAFEGAQITHGMRAAPGAIERVRIDPETWEPRFKVIGNAAWSDEWGAGPGPVPASGICGSGIIEAVAELYLAGIIRADGRFDPQAQGARVQWDGRAGAYELATSAQTFTGEPILITQNDVRAIQLAKAALYAGAKLLMNQAGLERVDRIVLAGAFGSYIDPKHAMVLGLIPDCDLDQVYAVGNAAGDGARIALLNRGRRREAQRVARWVKYVETAVEPEFQQEFVAAMHLPHVRDPYPHLSGILPAQPAQVSQERARERRRKRRRRARDR